MGIEADRRPVIKAFNNILAHSLAELGHPEGSAGRLAITVAGDDVRSKQIVTDVVNETGFDPVDAGLWMSRGGSSQESLPIAAIMMRRRRGTACSRRQGRAPRYLNVQSIFTAHAVQT
jgi:predicted dinucleotide-binding enzyme